MAMGHDGDLVVAVANVWRGVFIGGWWSHPVMLVTKRQGETQINGLFSC